MFLRSDRFIITAGCVDWVESLIRQTIERLPTIEQLSTRNSGLKIKAFPTQNGHIWDGKGQPHSHFKLLVSWMSTYQLIKW